MPRFQIVHADTPELREAVYRFRYDVYVQLMKRRQIYADHERGTVTEPLDQHGRNYLALLDGRPIGTIRANTFDDPAAGYYRKLYRFDSFGGLHAKRTQLATKLMMIPEYQGTCFGVRLLCHYGLEGFRRGMQADFMDCNKHLVGFFERLGYFSFRGWAFHKEYGTVRPMFLVSDTIRYLRELKSVVASAAERYIADNEFGGYELIRRHAQPPDSDPARSIASRYVPGWGLGLRLAS